MIEYRNVSLADRVFETLEKNILTGVYPKGSVITEKAVSEELGVSRTPIREAFSRLIEEDLIESTSQGNVVRGITDEDVDDAYAVRFKIEEDACARAAVNVTDEILVHMKEKVSMVLFFFFFFFFLISFFSNSHGFFFYMETAS